MNPPHTPGVIVTVNLSTGKITSAVHSRNQWYRMLGGRPLVIDQLAQHGETCWVVASSPFAGLAIPLFGAATIGYRDCCGIFRTEQIYGTLAAVLRQYGIEALVVTGQTAAQKNMVIELGVGTVQLVDAGSSLLDEQLTIGQAADLAWPGATLVNRQGRRLADQAGSALAASGVRGIAYQTLGDARAIECSPARDTISRLVKASPLLSGPCGVQSFGWSALAGLSQSLGLLPTVVNQSVLPTDDVAVRPDHLVGCVGCGIACFGVDSQQRPDPDWLEQSSYRGLLGVTNQLLFVKLVAFAREQGISPDWLATIVSEVADNPLEIASQLILGEITLSQIMEYEPKRVLRIAGQPLPPFDPRGAVGQTLARLISSQPGSYQTAFVLAAELLRKPLALERMSVSGKARLIAMLEDARAAGDGVGACLLSGCAVDVEEFAVLLTELFAEEISTAQLLAIGRRTVLMERRLNRSAERLIDPRQQLPAFLFEQLGINGQPPLDHHLLQDEWQRYEFIRREQEQAFC